MITRAKAHAIYWLTLLGGVAADLLSKHIVFNGLSDRAGGVYEVWPGVFRLSLRHNTGGPFSLLRGNNALLVVITVCALGVIVYLYLASARRGIRLAIVALALIAAGALGNLADRLSLGCVRDFLDFYLINYPVFNLADCLITVGAFLLIIELFRGRQETTAPSETGA